jgi:hypothetical protein
MNRVYRYVLCLIALLSVYGFSKSVWTTVPIYHINLKPGDIIRIKFTEKTMLKYKIEKVQNVNLAQKGVTGKGEMFSFFPDIELKSDDTVKSKNQLNIDNQNKFTVSARVESVDGGVVSLKASTKSLINGQIFGVELSGECSVKFISADYSVLSYNLHNLDFEVKNYAETGSKDFSPSDLIFTTNFAEVLTNRSYTTNIAPFIGTTLLANGNMLTYTNIRTNLTTNYTFSTNQSSLRLKLEGLTDVKQKEIIIKYIGFIMNSLFK